MFKRDPGVSSGGYVAAMWSISRPSGAKAQRINSGKDAAKSLNMDSLIGHIAFRLKGDLQTSAPTSAFFSGQRRRFYSSPLAFLLHFARQEDRFATSFIDLRLSCFSSGCGGTHPASPTRSGPSSRPFTVDHFAGVQRFLDVAQLLLQVLELSKSGQKSTSIAGGRAVPP